MSPRLTTVTREMGISHRDLFRLLPRALAGRAYEVLADGIVIKEGERCVIIEYAPERERRIALLRVPVTNLIFRFTDYGAVDIVCFMTRFDRTFHRGGG